MDFLLKEQLTFWIIPTIISKFKCNYFIRIIVCTCTVCRLLFWSNVSDPVAFATCRHLVKLGPNCRPWCSSQIEIWSNSKSITFLESIYGNRIFLCGDIIHSMKQYDHPEALAELDCNYSQIILTFDTW